MAFLVSLVDIVLGVLSCCDLLANTLVVGVGFDCVEEHSLDGGFAVEFVHETVGELVVSVDGGFSIFLISDGY